MIRGVWMFRAQPACGCRRKLRRWWYCALLMRWLMSPTTCCWSWASPCMPLISISCAGGIVVRECREQGESLELLDGQTVDLKRGHPGYCRWQRPCSHGRHYGRQASLWARAQPGISFWRRRFLRPELLAGKRAAMGCIPILLTASSAAWISSCSGRPWSARASCLLDIVGGEAGPID